MKTRTDREIVLSAIDLMDKNPSLSEVIQWLSGMERTRVTKAVRSMVEDGTLGVGLEWELIKKQKTKRGK